MAWSRTTWVDDDGSLTVGTPYTAAHMNNMEDGIEALARRPESLHDASSNSGVSSATLKWTHTPNAKYVQGVLVAIFQNWRENSVSARGGTTYGGRAMKFLASQEEASKVVCDFYWLPFNEIPQGPQEVVVSFANTKAVRQAYCATVIGSPQLRPIIQKIAPAENLKAQKAYIENTLETGAFYGFGSFTKQPIVAGSSLGVSALSQNLGSSGTPMWAGVQVGLEPNAGKGTTESLRPGVAWETTENATYGGSLVLWGRVRDWGLVSALPTLRPGPGDLCHFFGASSYAEFVWDLEWDGTVNYPWRKIGGDPMRLFAEAGTEMASAAFLAIAGMELKPPLKGEYVTQHGCQVQLTGGASSNLFTILFNAGVVSNPTLGKMIGIDQFEGGSIISAETTMTIAKEAAITMRAQQFTNTVLWVMERKWMTLNPLRVG